MSRILASPWGGTVPTAPLHPTGRPSSRRKPRSTLVVCACLALGRTALAQDGRDLQELRQWDQAMEAWADEDLETALSGLASAYEGDSREQTACLAEMVARALGRQDSALVWLSRCESCVRQEPGEAAREPRFWSEVAIAHPERQRARPIRWWWAGLATSAALTVGTVVALTWNHGSSQGHGLLEGPSGQAALGLGLGAGAGWALTLALVPILFLRHSPAASSAGEEQGSSPAGRPPLTTRTEACRGRR